MKKNNLIYIAIIFSAILLGSYFLTKSRQYGTARQTISKTGIYGNIWGQGQRGEPNRGNCLADDCLLVDDLEYPAGELSAEVQEALDEAINDEYKARAIYEVIIAKFGTVRPFSMIKGAEEQHIASLKAIYDKYGLVVPKDAASNKFIAPATLKEACQIGVDAEIANAALYKDKLLPVVGAHEDIVTVFTSLMDASYQKHLPAFERCN